MSDLAATNCGCGCGDGGNNNCLLLILILLCCGGCGNGSGCGCGGNDCSSIIWIILLLSCCGGCGSFFGNGNGCGCGCQLMTTTFTNTTFYVWPKTLFYTIIQKTQTCLFYLQVLCAHIFNLVFYLFLQHKLNKTDNTILSGGIMVIWKTTVLCKQNSIPW